jgi:hypothetical protein
MLVARQGNRLQAMEPEHPKAWSMTRCQGLGHEPPPPEPWTELVHQTLGTGSVCRCSSTGSTPL